MMRRTSIATLLVVLGCMVGSAGSAHAQTVNPFLDIPVLGTARNGNAFDGTLSVLSFIDDPDEGLEAVGLLTGTITQPTGVASSIHNAVVLLPVEVPAAARAAVVGTRIAPAATCQILNLILAPLDLNLLGLTVHLNQVVLNIAAQSGAGNLLGNLLCAVTNLLNGSALSDLGSALLATLTALLNQILAAL